MRTFVHYQIKSKIFNKKFGVVFQGLAIQRVQQRMSRSICSSCATDSLPTLSEFQTLTSKGSLINLSFFSSGERNTIVFQFYDCAWGFFAHVVNSILVSQPVRTFGLDLDRSFRLGKDASYTLLPLTVSYACQRQSSSVMFPKAALIPP